MASEVSSSIKNNFDDLEIKFDTESIIKTSSPSMTFNEESKELMRIPSVDDEYDAHLDDATEEIDSVQNKIFDNLDLKRELAGIPGLSVGIPNLSCDDTDNNGYVSSAPSCSSTHDGAASKDGSEKSEEIKTSEVFEHRDMESFMKITGYVLSPPMTNPVDMTVYKSTIAIADYETGVHFVDRGGYSRKHFKVTDFKVCGVKFYHDKSDSTTHVAFLAFNNQKWSVNMYSWPNLKEEVAFKCPSDPVVPAWAKRKITVVDDILYLLATAESCSAIWTLDLKTTAWKTLIVERGRTAPNHSLSLNFTSKLSGPPKASVYSDFDVQRVSKVESRIILCEAQKSRLDALILNERNELIDTNTIKVKRRKEQKWIVQGPQLAVWDTEQDIIVFDGSGKIFWFDGSNYRIQKIVGDIGRSEACSMEAKDGWCYMLCRHQLKIFAFHYR